ncbi:putative membrane protein [Plantactinospora soyae]|uniref:Membrane protein n=1 Tax=Plantactinospora soyae TaxID=1544732 RepID=A0A927M0H5_9ACTN|nr:putative membrane protein [Plantactinospora soyae]
MSWSTHRLTRTLLGCGAVAPGLFILVFLVDGATRAGYDPTYHPVSALSLGPRGWIQITNFVLTGLLLLGFAVSSIPVAQAADGHS